MHRQIIIADIAQNNANAVPSRLKHIRHVIDAVGDGFHRVFGLRGQVGVRDAHAVDIVSALSERGDGKGRGTRAFAAVSKPRVIYGAGGISSIFVRTFHFLLGSLLLGSAVIHKARSNIWRFPPIIWRFPPMVQRPGSLNRPGLLRWFSSEEEEKEGNGDKSSLPSGRRR